MSVDFKGTAAIVRRRAGARFTGVDPGDAVWRGRVGPRAARGAWSTSAVRRGPRRRAHGGARRSTRRELDATVARAVLLENDALVLGRFRHRDGRRRGRADRCSAGTRCTSRRCASRPGPSAGRRTRSATASRRGSLRAARSDASLPVPRCRGAARRRGARGVRARAVERFLRQLYGAFEDDPNWGYHGGFGSTRVFCRVRHYLETSTAVIVGSPVLERRGADRRAGPRRLRGRRARAASVASRSPPERGELWFEHAILGDDLDPDELRTAIDVVASGGRREDDRLKRRTAAAATPTSWPATAGA